MRRTLERSQKARQKPNRWSWGGALNTNAPSTPAGTFTHHTPTVPAESFSLSRCSMLRHTVLPHSLPVGLKSFLSIVEPLFLLKAGGKVCFQVYWRLLISHLPNVWQCVSCVNMSACLCVSVLFCHVCIWTFQIPCPLLLLLTHTLLCLSLSPLFSNSLSYPHSRTSLCILSALCFSAIVLFPSWSRFCRVGFPLSTRPCWTGAHAECFQSLPQIRNDLPMWIL